MQLIVSDIDGIDAGSTAIEQHFAETAGRGAKVEADPFLGIDGECVERSRELNSAAGNIGMREARAEFSLGRKRLRGSFHQHAVSGNQSCFDCCLRTRPAWREATLDQ